MTPLVMQACENRRRALIKTFTSARVHFMLMLLANPTTAGWSTIRLILRLVNEACMRAHRAQLERHGLKSMAVQRKHEFAYSIHVFGMCATL